MHTHTAALAHGAWTFKQHLHTHTHWESNVGGGGLHLHAAIAKTNSDCEFLKCRNCNSSSQANKCHSSWLWEDSRPQHHNSIHLLIEVQLQWQLPVRDVPYAEQLTLNLARIPNIKDSGFCFLFQCNFKMEWVAYAESYIGYLFYLSLLNLSYHQGYPWPDLIGDALLPT